MKKTDAPNRFHTSFHRPPCRPANFRLGLKTVSCCLVLLGPVATSRLQAATVNTGTSSLFPSVAEIIAAKPSDPGLNAETAAVSMMQTFQTDTAFDLQRIFIRYRTSTDVNLSIFTVLDVNAATQTDPPTTSIFSETIALPATASTLTAEIVLDSPLSISASTGTEGFGIRFSGDTTFQWYRTGATAGSVYAGGTAYEDGVEKTGGRDFVLALSTIPEPSALALFGCGLLALAGWRTRRLSR